MAGFEAPKRVQMHKNNSYRRTCASKISTRKTLGTSAASYFDPREKMLFKTLKHHSFPDATNFMPGFPRFSEMLEPGFFVEVIGKVRGIEGVFFPLTPAKVGGHHPTLSTW